MNFIKESKELARMFTDAVELWKNSDNERIPKYIFEELVLYFLYISSKASLVSWAEDRKYHRKNRNKRKNRNFS